MTYVACHNIKLKAAASQDLQMHTARWVPAYCMENEAAVIS